MTTAITLQSDRLATLRRQLEAWSGDFRLGGAEGPVIPSGIAPLDRALARGGFAGYELIEWFAERPGSGASQMAWTVAGHAARATADHGYRRVIVVVDPDRTFYPPAAASGDIDLTGIVIVRPRNLAELIWTWDQALRSTAVAAVWGSVPRIDPRDFRRLQLAAEQGRTLGLLLRAGHLRRDPSWAHIQLLVTPRSSPPVKVIRQR